jgi:enterochelin esterase-like enzyme
MLAGAGEALGQTRPARTAPPARDPHTPGYVNAKELPDGQLPPADAEGNFVIGPTHKPAPELAGKEDLSHGKVIEFLMNSENSKIYPGIARDRGTFGAADPSDPAKLIVTTSHPAPYVRRVAVYVPSEYKPGTAAPFIVGADGPDRMLFASLDHLIPEHKVPAMVAISIGSGSGDAQGSERGLEYDTMSGLYAEFVEKEVLPIVEEKCDVKLTKDPEGRATMGCSSGAACAMIMAWYHPEWYHRVLSYSGTFVNQQWPHNDQTPHGAWALHERLIPNSPAKPIRIWMEVGDRDLLNPNVMRDNMHDWVLANENMAKALADKGYHYQFVFARNATHCDGGVKRQSLPEALEFVWQGYRGESKLAAQFRSVRVNGADGLADLHRRLAAVERVEVEPVDAVGQQVLALLGRVLDAGGIDRLRIRFQALEVNQQRVRDLRAAHRDKPLDLRDVEDRHDPGHDRHLDPHHPGRVAEAVELRVVEEQLRHDEAPAVVDFALQVFEISRHVEALRVAFGIARDADAELVASADEFDQLVGIREAAFGGDEIGLARLRVAAEGQDVADAGVPQFVHDPAQFLGGVADAGEVGHRADLQLVLDALDQIDGLLAGAPAGAIGDGDVAGVQRVQFADRPVELREPLLVLGREKLERYRRLPQPNDLVNPHRSDSTLRSRAGPPGAGGRGYRTYLTSRSRLDLVGTGPRACPSRLSKNEGRHGGLPLQGRGLRPVEEPVWNRKARPDLFHRQLFVHRFPIPLS